MRIAIIAPGSRGDVQPYVALGKGLQEAGHAVRLVTQQDFETLVRTHGVEFWPIEGSVQEVIQGRKMRQVLESGSLFTSMAQMAREMKRAAVRLAERGLEACRGMDRVLAGIGGVFAALSLAEKLGLPLLQAYNVPFTPTRAFSGALLPRFPSGPGGALHRLSHHLTRQIVWQAYRPADRVVRRQVLGLPPSPLRGPFGSDRLARGPILYGLSPSVIPPPPDWGDRVHVTGYWFLDPPADWSPPPALEQFLQAGPPPVYVGFGSMSNRKPEETAALVVQALARAGQRAILLSGWGGLSQADLPDTCLMVDAVPHAWLFPRVAAVVHHGGAGTTAAGLRAGVPSIIVPLHGDQPFWGRRVAELGVGPAPIPRRKLTAERLAGAIQEAMADPAMRQRAAHLGRQVRAESGIAGAVEVVGQIERRGSA
jgi:sterol 3beta-glucosyltransferase